MSDAPLSLESFDRDGQPARSAALPLGQAGGPADAQDALTNGEPAPASATASDPDPIADAEQASPPAPQVNGSAVGHADPQPAIEPGSLDAPIVSDAALEFDQPAPPLVLEPAPPPAAGPVPEVFAAAPAEHADSPDGHVPPPAEIPMEVSPIFSALDAAEKATTEAGREPPPATVPADYTILLPQQPRFGGARRDAPDPVAAETTGDAVPETEPPPEAADAPAALAQEVPQLAELIHPEAADAPATPAEEQSPPTELLHDAAAKIAEEANATAEALESLKRLLNQKLSLLDPAPISTPAPITPPPAPRAAAPPSIPAFQLPAQTVKPPPMVPLAPPMDLAPLMTRAPVRRRLSLGGFLAGFALSWVFGAMLYIYLTLLG